MKVGKTFKFDSAHYLPHYEGKCKEMHGHTWHVTVEISGPLQVKGPHRGMVMDLNLLKDVVEKVISKWDHQVLNNFLECPTCEVLAGEIYKEIQENLPESIYGKTVKVQEGEGGYAIFGE